VQAVVNAPRQFEPVMRAGGDWRRLPEPNEVQRAHIETILNLALDGRLPDPTHGARYFQNPRIVAARAARGDVSPRLVDFGGAARTAVIGGHVFYARRGINTQPLVPSERPRSLFVGEPRAPEDPGTGETIRGQGLGQAIFVASDGAARAAPAPP
jgi:hypothetical protein